MSKNVWQSFTNQQIDKNSRILDKKINKLDQKVEHNLLRKLSENLIIENCEINPSFRHIRKISSGYSLNSRCLIKGIYHCAWTINLNIQTNEAFLSYPKKCTHKNQIKNSKILIFLISCIILF